MQRFQEHATNLEETVMKYEQQIQQLRSDLDMLVLLARAVDDYTVVHVHVCVCVQYTHLSILSNCPHCISRERRHRITVGTMTGVIQKTAERDVLEGVVTSYFTDNLQSFVNELQLTGADVYSMEDKIMTLLAVSESAPSRLCKQIIIWFHVLAHSFARNVHIINSKI